MKALNTLISSSTPFRLWSERLPDGRTLTRAEPGQGQELKRTYDKSFGDTNNSSKEAEDSSPEERVKKVSAKRGTLTHIYSSSKREHNYYLQSLPPSTVPNLGQEVAEQSHTRPHLLTWSLLLLLSTLIFICMMILLNISVF